MSLESRLLAEDLFFAYRTPYGRFMKDDMDTVRRMADIGVNTICFFAANTVNRLGEPYCPYAPTWKWIDQYDFDPLDEQIHDLLEANPNAVFICMVDLNSPLWLTRVVEVDSFTQLGHCIHNKQWLEETLKYLRAFLEHTEKNYASRIKAYHLAFGKTIEWFDRTEGEPSDLREEAFQNWCKARGIETFRIPSRQQRYNPSHDLLRDPTKDAQAITYWKFCSEAVTDIAIEFVNESRKIIRPETQLGLFYGAIITFGRHYLLSSANVDYERLYDTPGLNYVAAAGSNSERRIGEGSGFIVPHESLRMRNMHYLHECDHRTHSSNLQISDNIDLSRNAHSWEKWPDEQSTIAGLKREFALCLIKRASLWWFNIWGQAYQGKAVWETLSRLKKLWDDNVFLPVQEISEVLMVCDPESIYYIDDSDPRCSIYRDMRAVLNRLGGPYDTCSFNDLKKLKDIKRYKLVIFPGQFVLDGPDETFLRQKVLNSGRTVFWSFAPGVIDKKEYRPSRVRELTGCEPDSKGLQSCEMNGWMSAYLRDPSELTPKMLRGLADKAGVHLYTEQGLSVYANSRFVSVHSAGGGGIKVRFPKQCERVVEMFSGKTIACDANEIEVDFAKPDTRLFCCSQAEL